MSLHCESPSFPLAVDWWIPISSAHMSWNEPLAQNLKTVITWSKGGRVLCRLTSSMSSLILSVILMISKNDQSINVLFYVCSHQGDIRQQNNKKTPPCSPNNLLRTNITKVKCVVQYDIKFLEGVISVMKYIISSSGQFGIGYSRFIYGSIDWISCSWNKKKE